MYQKHYNHESNEETLTITADNRAKKHKRVSETATDSKLYLRPFLLSIGNNFLTRGAPERHKKLR